MEGVRGRPHRGLAVRGIVAASIAVVSGILFGMTVSDEMSRRFPGTVVNIVNTWSAAGMGLGLGVAIDAYHKLAQEVRR